MKRGVTFSNVWPKKILFCYCTIHLIVLYNCEEYLIKPTKHLILLRHEFHTVYCLYVFIIKTYIYGHLWCFLPNIQYAHITHSISIQTVLKKLCWRKTCSVWKLLFLFFQIMRPLTWTNFGFRFIHRPNVYCRAQLFTAFVPCAISHAKSFCKSFNKH